jgi:zinc protease
MNKWIIALLWLQVAPAIAGVTIQAWTAPSGAKVFFVETKGLPILDVQIDFAAGGAHAPPELSGVAGLTAGLLDAGAGDLNEEQIAEQQVATGAQMSGGAELDRASHRLRTLSSQPERDAALELFRAVLSAPTFPADILEREKTRSIAAIRDAATRPDAIADRRFAAALYSQHPYGVQPGEDSVARIGRDDLVNFYHNHYGARSATVSLIGNVSRAEAEAIAQRLTESLPVQASAAATIPPVALPEAQTIRVAHPATQSHVLVGVPAVVRGDPDFFPLLVGNYSLGGGGFVSRLMKEVREKRGYAYSVYSAFSPRKAAGPFQIGLQTQREQTSAALELVNQVLRDYVRTGPTKQELAAAKKNLVNGQALGMDSNAKLLGYLSLIGYFGLPLSYLDDFPARVNAVSAEQVKAAFIKHVPLDRLVTVIVAGNE